MTALKMSSLFRCYQHLQRWNMPDISRRIWSGVVTEFDLSLNIVFASACLVNNLRSVVGEFNLGPGPHLHGSAVPVDRP